MSEPKQTTVSGALVEGRITRVNGPIVEAVGMARAGMLEVVEVGDDRLIGEVIRTSNDSATIQVYENTSGLRPGMPVRGTGQPLSLKLGPGLLQNIYDGIQRPLEEIASHSGFYIRRGEKAHPLDIKRQWAFTPTCKVGDVLKPGDVYGKIPETGSVEHRLLVPPGVSGTVLSVVPAGQHGIDDEVCVLDLGKGATRTLTLAQFWPVRRPRPSRQRLPMSRPLLTGLRVIDTFFPIATGGTAAVPGGFGTGKTMTQHALAKWCEADIIVYIGCGERGNEMTGVLREFPELIDPRTGRTLMERTVLIANTSNMPVAAREVCIYTGITIAEYYRDMGYSVALMADSTSRWAEALRELSGRLEEMPADEGFPAYLPTRLASFYERAGNFETLNGGKGAITVIGAVSPPGGDFSEPVTQHTSRFIRCFWALDRQLANARHYPAISWLKSYSEYLPEIEKWWHAHQDSEWRSLRDRLVTLMQQEQGYQRIAKLVGPDALPEQQRLVLMLAEMIKNGFLQQNSFDPEDMYCPPAKQMGLMRLLASFADRASLALENGVSLADIRVMACVEAIVRARGRVPNSRPEGMDELRQAMIAEFEVLERRNA